MGRFQANARIRRPTAPITDAISITGRIDILSLRKPATPPGE